MTEQTATSSASSSTTSTEAEATAATATEGQTSTTTTEGGSTPQETSQSSDAKAPETPDGYTYDFLGEKAKGAFGDLTADPLAAEARAYAHEKGWTQAQFAENIGGLMDRLAEKGHLDVAFDPAAERAALGEHGETRQRELEVFFEGLKTRGEIDDAMFGEAMSLVPTAAGVKLFEYFKGQMRAPSAIDTGGAGVAVDLKAKAQEMAQDPKYRTDRAFKAEADAVWKQAYGA